MGIVDIIWMVVILVGCAWLLYHFLWKKQGSCHGCDHGDTTKNKR